MSFHQKWDKFPEYMATRFNIYILRYGLTFITYFDKIDHLQRIFGLIILCREFLYFILTIVGLFINPLYLLVSIGSAHDQPHNNFLHKFWSVIFYVCAPEKFILVCLKWRDGEWICFFMTLLCLPDLFCVIGFIYGIYINNLPIPLGISYAVTSAPIFFFILTFITINIIFILTGVRL